MKSHNVKLYSIINLAQKTNYDLLLESVNQRTYENNLGFGFKNTIQRSHSFTSTLIYRTPTNIPQLNPETGIYEDQVFYIFREVDFLITHQYEMLFVFGSVQDAKELVSTLNHKLNFHGSISPLKLQPSKVVKRLIDDQKLINVEQMTIRKFQYREGIVGRYTFRTDSIESITEFIQAYGLDVCAVRLLIDVDYHNKVLVNISNSGAMTVRCDEDEFNLLILSLIPILTSKGVING